MPEVLVALYPTESSDQEWAILAPLLPPTKPGGRPRSINLRAILSGIFHMLRSGCQWRLLPRDYGPWSTMYAYFRRLRLAGSGNASTAACTNGCGGRRRGVRPTPSAAIIDSQSVKATEPGGPHGYDGAKKLSGRQRPLLVDTLSLVQGIRLHPADVQGRVGAGQLLPAQGLPTPHGADLDRQRRRGPL